MLSGEVSTANKQYGIVDYIEPFNINRPLTRRYIRLTMCINSDRGRRIHDDK